MDILKDWIKDRDDKTFVSRYDKFRLGWEDEIEVKEGFSSMIYNLEGMTPQQLVTKAYSVAMTRFNSMNIHGKRLYLDPELNCTDGNAIWLSTSMFVNEDLSNGQRMDVFLGLAVHEAAHILYTDFSYMKKCTNSAQRAILNIIEDEYIERCVGKDFPGYTNYIAATKAEFFGKTEFDRASDINTIINLFLMFIRYPKGLPLELVEEFRPLMENLYKIFSKGYPESSEQCFEKMKEVYKYLKRYYEKELPENKLQEKKQKLEELEKQKAEREQRKSEEKGDGEGEGGTTDEQEDEHGESSPEGKGNDPGSEPQSSDEQQNDDGGDPSPGTSGEGGEGDDEKDEGRDDVPQQPEGEGENTEETSETEEQEDGTETAEETGTDTNPEDQDRDEAGGGDDSDSTEDGTESEDDDVDPGDTGDTGKDSEDEGNEESSNEKSGDKDSPEDPEETDESVDASTESGNDDEEPEDPYEEGENDEDSEDSGDPWDDDSGEGASSEGGDESGPESSEESIDELDEEIERTKKEILDIEDEISERSFISDSKMLVKAILEAIGELQKDINERKRKEERTEITGILPEVEGREEKGTVDTKFIRMLAGNKYKYQEIASALRPQIAVLKTQLKLDTLARTNVLKGLRNGKLDPEKIVEARMGVPTVYTTKSEKKVKGGIFAVLIDESGSMDSGTAIPGKRRIDLVQEMAVMLNEAMIASRLECYFYGHTADMLSGVDGLVSEHTEYGHTFIKVYKEKSKDLHAHALGLIRSEYSNRDGHAIYEVVRRVRSFTKEPLHLIVLSDGQPAAVFYNKGVEDTRDKIKLVESKFNTTVYGVGIDVTYEMSSMYTNYINFTNLEDFPRQMGQLIRQIVNKTK